MLRESGICVLSSSSAQSFAFSIMQVLFRKFTIFQRTSQSKMSKITVTDLKFSKVSKFDNFPRNTIINKY